MRLRQVSCHTTGSRRGPWSGYPGVQIFGQPTPARRRASMNVLYTAEAVALGEGRNGEIRSSDGVLDELVAIPAEMGGPGGGTNPEQLFAAGYAACFNSALRMAARLAKVEI